MTDKWFLELPELDTKRNEHRNLAVQVESTGSGYHAELIDLECFDGVGATEAAAIQDLISDLTDVAAAIARASGQRAQPMAEWFTLAEKVFAIAGSDVDDELKYDLIFGDGLRRRLNELRALEYYDPDGSYAEDVGAFVGALQRQYDDMRKIRHVFTESR